MSYKEDSDIKIFSGSQADADEDFLRQIEALDHHRHNGNIEKARQLGRNLYELVKEDAGREKDVDPDFKEGKMPVKAGVLAMFTAEAALNMVSSMSASLLCEPFVEPLHGRRDCQFRDQVFGVRDTEFSHAAQFYRDFGLQHFARSMTEPVVHQAGLFVEFDRVPGTQVRQHVEQQPGFPVGDLRPVAHHHGAVCRQERQNDPLRGIEPEIQHDDGAFMALFDEVEDRPGRMLPRR